MGVGHSERVTPPNKLQLETKWEGQPLNKATPTHPDKRTNSKPLAQATTNEATNKSRHTLTPLQPEDPQQTQPKPKT